MMKKIKKSIWYRELWYFYYHVIRYKHPLEYFGYLYRRFWTRYKMRRVKHPIGIAPKDDSYSVHFLSSHRGVDLLLWSLASWYRVVPNSGQIYIHEDGGYTDQDRAKVMRIFPHVKIVDFAWATKMAEEVWLKDFPYARARRAAYKNHMLIFKLIDPRFVSSAPRRLVLDNDVLWFKEPTEVLQGLKNDLSFTQYAEEQNSSLTLQDGSKIEGILGKLNSGIVGYHVFHYLPELLEEYCRKLPPDYKSHFIEQFGYAWILGGEERKVTPLPKERYVLSESVGEKVVARHYTRPRREDFWREGTAILEKLLFSKRK